MNSTLIPVVIGGLIAIAGAAISFISKSYYDKKNLNKAVFAEISRLLFIINRQRDYFKNKIKIKNSKPPVIPFFTAVYNEQLKNIGLIDDSAIVHVVKFYGYVIFINSLVSIRDQYKSPVEFNTAYLDSLNNIIDDYSSIFERAFIKYKIL